MSKNLRNKFVKIIEKMPSFESLPEDVKSKRFKLIMDDIDSSRIFESIGMMPEELEDMDDLADIHFNPALSHKEKKRLEKLYLDRKEENTKQEMADIPCLLSSEERIRRKQKEFGVAIDAEMVTIPLGKKLFYGRSPLHECVANKCLSEIKLYAAEGEYLFSVDNNGNTPYEMAYYDNYVEAMEILKVAMDNKKYETNN